MQGAICLEHNKGKINDLIVSAWKARERTIGSVFGIKVLEDYDLDDSGDAYNDSQPLDYFLKSKEKLWFIHPQTKKELEALLRILNDHGEEKLLHYIKYRYLKDETRKIRY